jgi:glucosamine--fructose-6-phosphate aminotransferase (isomerizing)
VSVGEAFTKALHHLHGTFAIVMISRHEPAMLFCARAKSPLLLGIASEACCVGPVLNAFLPYTRRAIILDDGEHAILSRNGYYYGGSLGAK